MNRIYQNFSKMLCARNIWLIIARVFNYYTHKRLINQYTCVFVFFSNLYIQFINICMYACVMMTTEMYKNADHIYARHMFFTYSIILAFFFCCYKNLCVLPAAAAVGHTFFFSFCIVCASWEISTRKTQCLYTHSFTSTYFYCAMYMRI